MPHNHDVEQHARAILADTPLPAGWPATGRAWPGKYQVPILRKAGWPVETVTALVPQREHRGVRSGQQTGEVPQPPSVVPMAWPN